MLLSLRVKVTAELVSRHYIVEVILRYLLQMYL